MLRRLLRHFNLLNLLLLGVLIMLVRYTLNPTPEPRIKVTPPVQKEGVEDITENKETHPSSPADYIIIAEQNPFHPERKIPVEKKAEQPLPKPDFVLYGTLVSEDLKIAYLEDLKSPVSTPGRGKRQTPLKVGQSLSGFTLKEIEADKVVMVRGEENMVVYLNDPSKQKTREATTTAKIEQPQQRSSATPHGSREGSANIQTTPSQPQAIKPPPRSTTAPKEPLTPEQVNKARDTFLRFFQRR